MGGGMLFGGDGSVSYGFDLDCSSGAVLSAQEMFDELTDWPGCANDVFGFGGSTPAVGTLYLCAGKILRGNSWGLVLDGTSGKSGVTVKLSKTGTSEDDGSAKTDSIGEYRQLVSGSPTGSVGTGTPFGKGGLSYDTRAVSGSNPTVTRTQLARRRMRASFTVLTLSATANPWNLQDHWGRYHKTLVRDGNILYWRSDFIVPLAGNTWALAQIQVTSAGKDRYPRLAFTPQGLLFCTWERHEGRKSETPRYNMRRAVSWDDGATWGGDGSYPPSGEDSVVAIANGTKPTCEVGIDGTYVEAALVLNADQSANPGGVLKARKQGTGDVSLSDLYTFVDHDSNPLMAADDTFHLQQGKSGTALWLLHVKIQGDDDTSDWYSSDVDASSWTRITP